MRRKTRLFLRIQLVLGVLVITAWALKHEVIDVNQAKCVLRAQLEHAKTKLTEVIQK